MTQKFRNQVNLARRCLQTYQPITDENKHIIVFLLQTKQQWG